MKIPLIVLFTMVLMYEASGQDTEELASIIGKGEPCQKLLKAQAQIVFEPISYRSVGNLGQANDPPKAFTINNIVIDRHGVGLWYVGADYIGEYFTHVPALPDPVEVLKMKTVPELKISLGVPNGAKSGDEFLVWGFLSITADEIRIQFVRARVNNTDGSVIGIGLCSARIARARRVPP